MRVMVVDDERIKRVTLGDAVMEQGYEVATYASAEKGLEALACSHFHAIITDIRMPGLDGMTFLKRIRENSPETYVILMTAYGSVDLAVEAMHQGAYDFVTKPFSNDEMLVRLERIQVQLNLVSENAELKQRLQQCKSYGLIGKSDVMQHLYEIIHMVAASDATALIQGESGTGKELVATAIHEASSRKNKPLVAVHCAVLTESLFESELFGHEKGAFTGAVKTRKGRFEEADGGTIFFDEVDDIPMGMQVKLLRVLQNHAFQRVGGNQNIQVDVRVVAATKQNLLDSVAQGSFREDLFYRLNVVPILLPPLRQRREDIPLLVDHFIRKYGRADSPRQIAPEALDALVAHHWPGNVRELENVVERMVVLSRANPLLLSDVPASVKQDGPSQLVQVTDLDRTHISLEEAVEELERKLLSWALEKTGGNKSQAAEKLQLRRMTFSDKLGKYGF